MSKKGHKPCRPGQNHRPPNSQRKNTLIYCSLSYSYLSSRHARSPIQRRPKHGTKANGLMTAMLASCEWSSSGSSSLRLGAIAIKCRSIQWSATVANSSAYLTIFCHNKKIADGIIWKQHTDFYALKFQSDFFFMIDFSQNLFMDLVQLG